ANVGGVEHAVADEKIEVGGGVDLQAVAAHPDAAFPGVDAVGCGGAIGGGIEDVIAQLLEGRRVEPQDPAVVRVGIGNAGITDVEYAAGQGQRRTLQMLVGGEGDHSARTADAVAGNGDIDHDRAEGSIGAGGDVQGMDSMQVRAALVCKSVEIHRAGG